MTKRTLILALLFGASVAAGSQLLKLQLTTEPEQKMSEVLVLMQDIPRGKTLTAEMFGKRKYLTSALPFGVVSKLEDAVGRISGMALRKGVLLENTLATKGASAGLQGMIPDGKRAFTIRTPNVASGVAGLVQPGDHVDVLLTVDESNTDDETGGGAVVTLLRNIEVLAVDQQLDGLAAAPAADKSRGRTSASQPGIKSVTLIASPDDAMRLSLAQSKGTLQLSLRSPGSTSDESMVSTVAITFNDLLGRTKKLLRDVPSTDEKREPKEERRATEPVVPATPARDVFAADVQVAKAPEPPALPPIVMYQGNSRSTVDVSLVQGRQYVSRFAPAAALTNGQIASTGR